MGACPGQHGTYQGKGLVTLTTTVDREVFTLKIICMKNFCVIKFLRFRSIREIFLRVDNYNMDERLESFWRLVYYQVSGEPGIAGYSHWSDIYLRGVWTCACKLMHWSSPCNFIFCVLNFRGWSRPQNYFNSEIFPIYSMFQTPLNCQRVWWHLHTFLKNWGKIIAVISCSSGSLSITL